MAKSKKAEEQDNKGSKTKTAKKTTTKAAAKTTVKKAKAPEKSDAPNVITTPPFIVLFALIAGIVLDWILPMSFGYDMGWIGFIMFAVCFAGLKCCFKSFKALDTNLSPREPTNAIVTDGLYRYSRNPVYVSLLVGFIGLGFMADSIMMLMMVIPLFYTLALGIIIPEEEYLTEKFGDEYTIYKKKVRRWF